MDGHVGDDVDEVVIGRLSQAITVALLDQNPSPVNPPPDDWRAAHATATVKNARLIGHGIDEDGYTAFEYGVMVRMLVGGYRVGEDADVIAPPQELELPLNRPRIDDVYAAALYDVLSNLAEDSPDLPGAIRFLEVAWANSRSVQPEARILGLRAGFDVLFGGAQTNSIRSALSGLLDPMELRGRAANGLTTTGGHSRPTSPISSGGSPRSRPCGTRSPTAGRSRPGSTSSRASITCSMESST